MAGPLDGIQILDWTQWQMGPVATQMLADLGAHVIHVEERVSGDAGRALVIGGGIYDRLPDGRRAYFEINNRGKKSITLDLKKEKGKEVMYRLIKNADVFVENFRQGVPEKLGMDYESLCAYNPKIIYASASGFGPKGPDAKDPAFDALGQARSGIMTEIGEPDSPPQMVWGGIADQMGAIMLSYGILTALFARERLGIGQKIDVSHLGSMMALQALSVNRKCYLGDQMALRPQRKKARNPMYNIYQCKNGKWIMLSMLQPDRQWPALCKGLNIEALEKDPKYENSAKRQENCEELVRIMDQIFLTKTVKEWLKILKAAGDILCTPVQTMSDLLDDPQVIENNYIIECDHDVYGPVKTFGLPVQLSKTPGKVNVTAPEFGQHTEEILIEMGGYEWDEIEQLRDEEVI